MDVIKPSSFWDLMEFSYFLLIGETGAYVCAELCLGEEEKEEEETRGYINGHCTWMNASMDRVVVTQQTGKRKSRHRVT